MHKCWNCGEEAVIWQSDFDMEDYMLDGNGIVSVFHCTNCGADIEYYIGENEEGES